MKIALFYRRLLRDLAGMDLDQRIGWTLIVLTMFGLACATSVIDDAAGARTLTRGAVFYLVGLVVYGFWCDFPTVEREVGS